MTKQLEKGLFDLLTNRLQRNEITQQLKKDQIRRHSRDSFRGILRSFQHDSLGSVVEVVVERFFFLRTLRYSLSIIIKK